MLASRRSGPTAGSGVSLRDTLIAAGLNAELADQLDRMPHKVVQRRSAPTVPRTGRSSRRSHVRHVGHHIEIQGRQLRAAADRGAPLSRRRHSASRRHVRLRRPGDRAAARSWSATRTTSTRSSTEHPEIQRFFWRLTQRNEAIGYEWLVNCGRRDSTARVAHLLCETAVRSHTNVPEEPFHNPFTQQQIAEITGQTSVNVNRVMADLERQGLIERTGREITFTDWPEMRRVASFQPAYLE